MKTTDNVQLLDISHPDPVMWKSVFECVFSGKHKRKLELVFRKISVSKKIEIQSVKPALDSSAAWRDYELSDSLQQRRSAQLSLISMSSIVKNTDREIYLVNHSEQSVNNHGFWLSSIVFGFITYIYLNCLFFKEDAYNWVLSWIKACVRGKRVQAINKSPNDLNINPLVFIKQDNKQ